jgi:hypothetical protein
MSAGEGMAASNNWHFIDSVQGPVNVTSTSSQWYRQDPSGAWAPIAGATSETYTTAPTVFKRDNGAQFRVEVTLTCATGNHLTTVGPALLQVTPKSAAEWVDAATQPADVTVALGATANFIAMAYGDNTYQWQRSNDNGVTWADVPGATDWALAMTNVQATDRNAQFKLIATNRNGGNPIRSRAATLGISDLPATFASDDIQVGTDVVRTQDRLTRTGTGYSASIDLGLGTLGLSVDSSAGTFIFAGNDDGYRPLIFTNRSATNPLVLAAGDLHLEVNGSYIVVDGGNLSVSVSLSARTSGSPLQAGATVSQQINGPQVAQSTVFKGEQNGATVTLHQADAFGLNASLVMPQLTIPAGGTLTVHYYLNANGASGGDSMDFLTVPVKLCLRTSTLLLSNNLAVPMNWCNL